MAQINTGRVLLGGLLAGVIINVSQTVANLWVFAGQFEEILANLSLDPVGGGGIAVYIVFGFILGIAAVWIYAAIRPRFGPGVQTALMAGGAMWLLARAWPMTDFTVFLNLPMWLFVMGLIWTAVEALVATVAGAWLYQEGGEAAAAPPVL
jgi:hypothetical protein